MQHENRLTPAQRSRKELGAAIDQAVGFDALSAQEALILREQLVVDARDPTRSGTTRQTHLKSIVGKIEDRKVELLQRKFRARQLGYSGLLGLAIGDAPNRTAPLDRPTLMNQPVIKRIAEQNPHVDRSVILDKTLEFDVRWLTEPTIPRAGIN